VHQRVDHRHILAGGTPALRGAYASAVSPSETYQARVPARVGLVGNPSDGFGGAVFAAIVDDLAARVEVNPLTSGLRIRNESLGAIEWESPRAFACDVAAHGHRSEHRIVTAALQSLERHRGAALPAIEVEWSSTIPRSVGLGGSSAIVIAVIDAVVACTGGRLDPRVTAAVALEAETVGLGIAAGWQDRIVQAHRRAVLVDTAQMATVDGVAVPRTLAVPALDAEVVVGWRSADAEESGAYHADLRRRSDGDAVTAGMSELAALARRAAACAADGDHRRLVELIDASWSVRRRSMPLHPVHEALVETVRRTGAVATSPGSGGSVIAVPTSPEAAERCITQLVAAGADVITARLR